MVFNEVSLFFIGIGVIFVWITILTVVVIQMTSHYNKLTMGITSGTLKEVLAELIGKYDKTGKDIGSIYKTIDLLSKDGELHLQRLGIIRFNPFSDTGGSQSFTIAILDGKDNGIVMTSLYARTGNRWYIKHIKLGASEDVELSKEEQSAIKKARPIGGV
jgi:hypothetical protein